MDGIKIGIGFGHWQHGLPEPELLCKYAETAELGRVTDVELIDRHRPAADL